MKIHAYFTSLKYIRFLFLGMTVFWSTAGIAQQTGEVEFPQLGFTFTIPEGWQGQETENAYLMSNSDIAGYVILLPHGQSMKPAEMAAEARNGLNFDEGSYLTSVDEIKTGSQSVEGTFEGMLDYTSVKAYLIGLTNPHGNGITILSVSNPNQYVAETFQSLAVSVKNSIKFSPPVVPQAPPASKGTGSGSVSQWKSDLGGTRLTYMESYSSGGMSGGGYNMETQIHLCKPGYFRYSDKNFMSASGANTTAYSAGNSQGDGNWDIIDKDGSPYLLLNFNGGDKMEFALEWREGNKLYLDGYRYFCTSQGEYAPDCDE